MTEGRALEGYRAARYHLDMNKQTGRSEAGKPLLIAGLREHYTLETASGIPGQWKRMVRSIDKLTGRVQGAEYGVVLNSPDGRTGFDYLAGVGVSDTAGLPADFETISVPGQPFLVYEHGEHVSRLRETMNRIWHEWISDPNHSAAHGLEVIERYGQGFDPAAGFGDIEIWIPVSGNLGSS